MLQSWVRMGFPAIILVRMGTDASCHCCSPPPPQVGWVRSWSCYGPYVEEHGEEGLEGMLRTLRQELLAALRVPDERTPSKSVWPLTMILAKRPVPLAAGG